VQPLTFLCEQDGQIERTLKTLWVDLFKGEVHVISAWLARVHYGSSSEQKVALCLKAEGADKGALAERASSDFRNLFKIKESLDVIFLSPGQEQQLLLVARPFCQQHTHKT
jgi:hypothetical protein